MSFSSDLKGFRKTVDERADEVYKRSAIDLFTNVILATPVDKGVLRNNWFAARGFQGSREKTGLADISGEETVSRMEVRVNRGDVTKGATFLTNNLPYAYPIEFEGHSKKAPAGMVRINTIRWDSIVKRNVRKVANSGR